MGLPLIVLGDKTTHGGTVISCGLTTDTLGRGWARVGDMVSCRRCRGVFPISQGDSNLTDDGKPVAFHGCKVACGASLIASQGHTVTEPSGGGASGAGKASSGAFAPHFGAIGADKAARYFDEALNGAARRFRGRFQVLDLATGEPVVGLAVRVRSTSGQCFSDNTDAEGCTQWVERDADEALAFDLIQRE